MPPKYFPLRWESTGDEWWFASPIDWAAANGHYDLVRRLIHTDNNLLFDLTSLARIRRLETVWDDVDDERFNDVARCRSKVAQNLFRECETLRGHNSLIRAGYGGWLLYTAASAGDLVFVRELLDRDPLLVFGEGEYGVTDIFYAAARSQSREVFRAVFDCCLSTTMKGRREEVSSDFRWEMTNRAVHAAARGGNLGILMELLADGSDVLAYRDNQGSTVLHTAAGRGQVDDVKTRNAFASHPRLHGICSSPGTSFIIPDAEIVLHAGIEDTRRRLSCEFTSIATESESTSQSTPLNYKKLGSTNSSASWRFKNFLRWLGKKKERNAANGSDFEEDRLSFKSYSMGPGLQNSPVPLRQQFSRQSTKKKFTTHDVRQMLPKSNLGSPCSAFSESSWSSPQDNKPQSTSRESVSVGPSSSSPSPYLEKLKMKRKHGSFNLRSMNNFFCVGAHGQAVEKSINSQPHCQNERSIVV